MKRFTEHDMLILICLYNIRFQAFPQEFTRLENVTTCKENYTDILKVFMMPEYSSNNSISNDTALTDCEFYCALERTCWGCVKACNGKCQWNAVTHCERMHNRKDFVQQSMSQKPGKLIIQSFNRRIPNSNFIGFSVSLFCHFVSLFWYTTECCWPNWKRNKQCSYW